MGRRLYEKDVLLHCDIQAQPVVDSVSVDWTQSPTRNMSLAVGQREGQFFLQLHPSSTSVRTYYQSSLFTSRLTAVAAAAVLFCVNHCLRIHTVL